MEFSYRKHIMNSSDTDNKRISKFFVLKLFPSNKTIITIRGTQSFTDVSIDLNSSTATLENALKSPEFTEFTEFNFNTFLLNCSFHSGFLLSTLTIFKKIYQNYLVPLSNEEEVLICGHSMGGAEAAILGLLIKFCDQLETKNIKIITFNPGTYIVRNDAYYKMLEQLGDPTTFNNRIYRSAGDLISVCSLQNIYQTATILSDSNCGQEELIQKFTTTMENEEIAKSYTDLLDVNSFRESPGLSDIITMWNSDSKNFFFNDNYKIPFLITGRASVETHSLSNFKNLILGDSHPFNERSVDETPVGETEVDKSYGPLDFIIKMIALRTKVNDILGSTENLRESFNNFKSRFEGISKNEEIIAKIQERASSFFNMDELSKLPGIEKKEFIKDIFTLSSSEDLINLLSNYKDFDINKYQSFVKSITEYQSSTPGGDSIRKKRKGSIKIAASAAAATAAASRWAVKRTGSSKQTSKIKSSMKNKI